MTIRTTARLPAALLAMPLAATFVLTACGPAAQVKRQPGSWSQKTEILKLEGPGTTPEAKAQMQKMYDSMSAVSVCLTPAAVAKDDMGKAMEQMASRSKNCTFDKKTVSGGTLSISATCKQPSGGTVRMTVDGTTAATSQQVTVQTEGYDAKGAKLGLMQIRITSTRTGECKPGDMTPPDAPAAGGGAAGPAVKP